MVNPRGYSAECIRFARRILMNLRNAGQFEGLPPYLQMDQFASDRPRQAGYENMMYDRFANIDNFRRYGEDIDIAREIGKLMTKFSL